MNQAFTHEHNQSAGHCQCHWTEPLDSRAQSINWTLPMAQAVRFKSNQQTGIARLPSSGRNTQLIPFTETCKETTQRPYKGNAPFEIPNIPCNVKADEARKPKMGSTNKAWKKIQGTHRHKNNSQKCHQIKKRYVDTIKKENKKGGRARGETQKGFPRSEGYHDEHKQTTASPSQPVTFAAVRRTA